MEQQAGPASRAADNQPGWQWVILALSSGSFAIGTTEFLAMSVVPNFAADLRLSLPQAAHAISAYALGVTVGAPVLTAAAARYSKRQTVILLLALFALGNLLTTGARSYPTLLATRFLSGLPHGAYFGIAALIAASVVSPQRRARSVGLVMLGLSIATVVGVPCAQWLGTRVSWRWGFAAVAVIAVLAALLVWRLAPGGDPPAHSHWRKELQALRNAQVLLTLLVGAIGFGGMFSVYTFVTPTLLQITHAPASAVSFELAVFGLGLVSGSTVVPWLGDRFGLRRTASSLFIAEALVLALYPHLVRSLAGATVAIFLVGNFGALAVLLQTRLMEVSGESQSVAAALNHSAFNIANALGPLLAGYAIAAGYGLGSAGPVGAGLALIGLALFWLSTRKAEPHARAEDGAHPRR